MFVLAPFQLVNNFAYFLAVCFGLLTYKNFHDDNFSYNSFILVSVIFWFLALRKIHKSIFKSKVFFSMVIFIVSIFASKFLSPVELHLSDVGSFPNSNLLLAAMVGSYTFLFAHNMALCDAKYIYPVCCYIALPPLFVSIIIFINHGFSVVYSAGHGQIIYSSLLLLLLIFNDKKIISCLLLIFAVYFFIIGSRSIFLGVLLTFMFYRYDIKVKQLFFLLISFLAISYYADLIQKFEFLSLTVFNKSLTSGRGQIWSELLPIIQQNIVFGHGYDVSTSHIFSSELNRNLAAHNVYLELLFSGGLIVLFFFLNLIYSLVKDLKLYDYNTGGHAKLGACYIFGFLVHSIFNDTVLYTSPSIIIMFFFSFGFLYGIVKKIRSVDEQPL